MTRPAGKLASMTVKTSGRIMNIFACTGSAGCGFSFCWNHMVAPMISGQTPIIISSGGCQGIRPKRLKMVVGSGADRSLIQPKNGAWRISMVTNSTL